MGGMSIEQPRKTDACVANAVVTVQIDARCGAVTVTAG